jgi:hypothetical protein
MNSLLECEGLDTKIVLSALYFLSPSLLGSTLIVLDNGHFDPESAASMFGSSLISLDNVAFNSGSTHVMFGSGLISLENIAFDAGSTDVTFGSSPLLPRPRLAVWVDRDITSPPSQMLLLDSFDNL